MTPEAEQAITKTLNSYGIETLVTQNSDDEDFHSLAVWTIKELIEEAYALGQQNPS